MSHFVFLEREWPELAAEARRESLAYPHPRTACFYARRVLELAVSWLYKHDSALKLPCQDNLAALLAEPTFQNLVGQRLRAKARIVKDLGNLAVHSRKPVRDRDALQASCSTSPIGSRTVTRGALNPMPVSPSNRQTCQKPRPFHRKRCSSFRN